MKKTTLFATSLLSLTLLSLAQEQPQENPMEKIIETVVIDGVEFTIVEKPRTFYAGAHAVEPNMETAPKDIVYADDSNAFFRNKNAVDETIKDVKHWILPERKLFLWMDFENDERPCAVLFGVETASREQPEGVHVIEAEPTLLIKVKYNHAAWALTKKLTGKYVHQYQMTELFGLVRHVFCEGEGAEYEYNGDNGSGNYDAEYFYYKEPYYDGGFKKGAFADKYVAVPVKRRNNGGVQKVAVENNSARVAEPVAPRTTQGVDAMQEPPKEFKKIRFGGYVWLVLEEQDGKALVLSEKILETRRFHHSHVETTWEECELREYLNNAFYNTFDEEDKARILPAKLPPYVHPWYGPAGCKARFAQVKEKNKKQSANRTNGTDDHIFLLSVEEVMKYFGDSGDLGNRMGFWLSWEGTDWKDGLGQGFYDTYNNARRATKVNGEAWFWSVRTPGYQYHYITGINWDGGMNMTGTGVTQNDLGIRPAMWLKLEGTFENVKETLQW